MQTTINKLEREFLAELKQLCDKYGVKSHYFVNEWVLYNDADSREDEVYFSAEELLQQLEVSED